MASRPDPAAFHIHSSVSGSHHGHSRVEWNYTEERAVLARTRSSKRFALPFSVYNTNPTSRRPSVLSHQRRYSSHLSRHVSARRYKPLPSPPLSPSSSAANFPEYDPEAVHSLPRRWPSLYAPSGRHDQIEPRPDDAQTLSSKAEIPHGFRQKWSLPMVSVATLVACFVTQLDESIIATALPKIAAQFHSLGDIGWYSSAYYLPQAVLQPLFGQIYTRWRIKTIYLTSLFLFEAGSLMAALSNSSALLIIARAISGIGTAGVSAGHFHIFATCFSLKARTVMLNAVSATLVISSAMGPLVGGVVTQYLNWRWCFGINVPIGSAITLAMAVFLRIPDGNSTPAQSQTWKQRLLQLDILGTIFLTAMVVCILVGFHEVQSQPLDKTATAVVYVAAGLSAIALVIQQKLTVTETLLPLRIFGNRLVWAACGLMFSLSAGLATHVSFIPLYLQLVRDKSPLSSGTHTVPYVLSIFAGSIIMIVSLGLVRYLNIFFLTGVICYGVASGLFTTFDAHSSLGHIIGFQVLAGVGFGLCVLCIIECPQAILTERDVPYAQGVITMFQILGGAISTQIATLVFIQTLFHRLQTVPNLPSDQISTFLTDPSAILHGSSNNKAFAQEEKGLKDRILAEFSRSFSTTFYVSIILAGLALAFVLCMPWTRKRPPGDSDRNDNDGDENDENGRVLKITKKEKNLEGNVSIKPLPKARPQRRV